MHWVPFSDVLEMYGSINALYRSGGMQKMQVHPIAFLMMQNRVIQIKRALVGSLDGDGRHYHRILLGQLVLVGICPVASLLLCCADFFCAWRICSSRSTGLAFSFSAWISASLLRSASSC